MPKTSIIIPSYERRNMLMECLDSFKYQEGDFEIIVVLDGSNYGSFLSDYKKVRVYERPHLGISAALNYAKSKATGEYIMHFGDDDWSLPGHVATLTKYLDEHPEIDGVYGDHIVRTPQRDILPLCYEPVSVEEDLRNNGLFQVYPCGGTLIRADKCPDNDETLESAVDWEFTYRCLENGLRFARVPERLWVYRTGHKHEEGTKRQSDCCDIVLARRGLKRIHDRPQQN